MTLLLSLAGVCALPVFAIGFAVSAVFRMDVDGEPLA